MPGLDRRSAIVGLGLAAGGLAVSSRAGLLQGVTQPRVRPNLYNCEGCEAVGERSPEKLHASLVLANKAEPGERMILSGRVLTADGARPAANVVIYAHHTNAAGRYANGSSESEWSRRHGRLRGWVRTGSDGRYAFDTIKPAPYPNETMPAHVHLFIAEAGHPAYYIDDVVFDGEFGVTPRYRRAQELRGGSGIIRLERSAAGVWLARRDIRLERHA